MSNHCDCKFMLISNNQFKLEFHFYLLLKQSLVFTLKRPLGVIIEIDGG